VCSGVLSSKHAFQHCMYTSMGTSSVRVRMGGEAASRTVIDLGDLGARLTRRLVRLVAYNEKLCSRLCDSRLRSPGHNRLQRDHPDNQRLYSSLSITRAGTMYASARHLQSIAGSGP
jgi:hypothetical protein